METIYITDVAPRDGLQNQSIHARTAEKLQLIRLLALAGLSSVEVTSFVSPKAVPQMADAAELLPAIRESLPKLRASVLVPNLKGLERACAAGATEIAVVLSATEAMNNANIKMGLEKATHVCEETVKEAHRLGLRCRAYIAVAFDCPFEGVTPLESVLRLSAKMWEAGVAEIVIADTIGAAFPSQVKERFAALKQVVPVEVLAAHFHDTRGMGLANAWAALEIGIRRFDASAGGIGGCPFAPGAAGNVATEDLVLLAERSGFSTGIDLSRLVEAVDLAESILERRLGGHSINWLRRERERAHGMQPV